MDIRNQVASIQKAAISDPRFKQDQEVVVSADDAAFVNKLFHSMLPHFPAWRQTCPTDDDLNRLKMAWTKAIRRHMNKTGKALNMKAGVLACEESDSDWLPSVGKFIKWCDQSNDLLQFAQRALDLFNSGQRQIDNVGKMVTAKHGFDLKHMKAADTNKRFIELYLGYAEDNAIEALEAHLLAETVQLSEEQQREADNRAKAAQNEFLSKFGSLINSKPEEKQVKAAKTFYDKSLKLRCKSRSEIDASRERQLRMIKGK